jgi:hypothetical protein
MKKDYFTIDGEIKLENNGGEISGWKLNLPSWVVTNSFYPYHYYIPGEGWGGGARHSIENLDDLYDESRSKRKPILIFKLEGVVLPTGKTQDKNKITIECKFVRFTGKEVTVADL